MDATDEYQLDARVYPDNGNKPSGGNENGSEDGNGNKPGGGDGSGTGGSGTAPGDGAGKDPSQPGTPGKPGAADGSPNTNTVVKISKIKLSAISQKLAAGKTVQLSATITPKNAADQSLKWTSSNKKYATVSAKGKVTLKKKGAGKTVTITAAARDGSGVKAVYKIKIMKDAVKSVKFQKAPKSLKAGKSVTLKPVVKTTGKKANKTLKWERSNTKYAKVSKKGVVKAQKAGKGKTVRVTARATDGSGKKAVVKIKIK